MDNENKNKWPLDQATEWAKLLFDRLKPHCHRIQVAGSIRRHKIFVGDIEIVYVPIMKTVPDPEDLFAEKEVCCATECIETLQSRGILAKRRKSNESTTYGQKNKLMVFKPHGISVDLFATTEECWFNYLVCRTGPKDLNIQIAKRAHGIGWSWNPYGPGFSRNGEFRKMDSEQEVFKFVGMEYKHPHER